jgi:glutamate/tyrosine decarboxylase-like PLP-dependent enzyme
MLPSVVRECFKTLTDEGLLPIALVSTAGTTDFGTISPLETLGICAQELGLWFHVDAAVGGALMFSEQHRYRLAGIELVDSLTIYFHKLFISQSVAVCS